MKTPKDAVLRARVPQEYKAIAEQAARESRVDVSDIVREAFIDWCKRKRLIAA
jgi:hypothetical protein